MIRFLIVTGAVLSLAACEIRTAESPAIGAMGDIKAADLAGRWEMQNRLVPDSKSKGGISIKIIADTPASAPDGGRLQTFLVEPGLRDGALVGCQVSEDGRMLNNAACKIEKGRFIVDIGNPGSSKLSFEMGRRPDGSIGGESFMRGGDLPLGNIKIGDIQMIRLPKAPN